MELDFNLAAISDLYEFGFYNFCFTGLKSGLGFDNIV